MKALLVMTIILSASMAMAELKFDGKTADGEDCVIRIFDDVRTPSGIKKLVVVEGHGQTFLNQASLMVAMNNEATHLRSIETVQRGSSVYNNLFLSTSGASAKYTSDLVTKSSYEENIFICESAE